MNIPWQKKAEFQEVLMFFTTVSSNRGHDLDPVRSLAGDIRMIFREMDSSLDSLCAVTCPDCRNNCCQRATIWYDFRDLLYLFFGPGSLPGSQISKNSQCSCLTDTGCSLPRSRRPFVCTWYFCPDQKEGALQSGLTKKIQKLKDLRSRMETEFCRITGESYPGITVAPMAADPGSGQ
ncbi:MAG: hypothetical protein MI863_27880 [Desulfobacterales bacterium]|nr:hypothetical protein [Desulfobacterales bacterium]